MNDTKKPFSFSQPNSFKLILNHGEKFFYFLVFVGFLYTYKDLKGQFLIDVVILISSLFFLLAILRIFLKNIIWRMDVDFNEKKISFNLCRSNSPILIKFNEIDQIKVSGPIVFIVGRKKYYYSTNQYDEILIILNEIKNITWGQMCDILGPNKSLRDVIDGKNQTSSCGRV